MGALALGGIVIAIHENSSGSSSGPVKVSNPNTPTNAIPLTLQDSDGIIIGTIAVSQALYNSSFSQMQAAAAQRTFTLTQLAGDTVSNTQTDGYYTTLQPVIDYINSASDPSA